MILENGIVRTMEPALPTARALALAGERVAGGVGTHETSLASPERVDLGGRCVLPAFTDAHVHFPTWSLAQRQVRLEGAATLEETLALIAPAAERAPRDRWLRGYGWRDAEWPPATRPTKEALDAVTGDVPVALWSKDYHTLWLNSAGLARSSGSLLVEGGLVDLDERGEPAGVLREESAWHFRDEYVRPTEDELVEASRAGVRLANERGVAAVHDKDGWIGALRVWQRLRDDDALTLRVWQSLPHDEIEPLGAVGLRSGFGDELLRIGYLKVFMDGTLGSQTAWLLDGSGVVLTTGEELAEIIRRAARIGFPVGVHAIGDRANREALDAFEATADVWRPLGLRQRVEHAQVLAAEDVGRFAELGVTCSVQFSHAPSDRDLVERFWADKADRAYLFRTLLDSGALLCNGSDAPIEELDPLEGLRAGVLRTLDERPAWQPEQALTVEEVLRAMTVAPAWLAGDERRRGRLVPGLLADLVVLDRDPVACAPEELTEVRVVATMLGGRWVHNPPPWD